MKLSEYIEVLKQKLVELGVDPEVVVTQSGYYSDGPFADLYENPEIEEVKTKIHWDQPDETKPFLVLGHSYQSY